MESILLIRWSALGDVVLATSALTALQARFPEARVAWLTDERYAPLLPLPEEALITFRRDEPPSRGRALERVRGRFALAVDLQNKLWSRRLAGAAAPRVVRLVKRTPGQALASLLGRDPVLDGPHATELQAAVLRPLGVEGPGPLALRLPEDARARAEALLPGAGWVGLVPGAAWATKRWAPERYRALSQALVERGERVVLLGGPMDRPQLEVARGVPGVVELWQEPLPVVAAAIARCRAVVGGDSGLMHVASAQGVRAVVLFGPTSVKRWGPPAPGVAVSLGLQCAPCTNHGTERCPKGHHRCLEELQVERVLEAVVA